MPKISNEFVKFVGVGGSVFVVDYAIFFSLHNFAELSIHNARVIAFICSVLLSWQANRRFTFKNRSQKPAARQLIQFVLVTSTAGLFNLAGFSLLAKIVPNTQLGLALCFAFGVGIGMVINWLASHLWVYRNFRV